MKRKQSLLWYWIIVILSLFVVLFVWRTVDSTNGTSSFTITPTGYTEFKKWMDIAWWVRLYYKIDLSTYKEVYTDPAEYSAVTRNIQNIILQNIDWRVSKLWVSDYESKIQTLEDGQYVVIDLWWVNDLNQAKAIIGKTVELEFKTPYQGDWSDVAAWRQSLAEEILKQASATPDEMNAIASAKWSEWVFYQNYESATLEILPQIYQDNPDLLLEREWSVYPTVTQGIYSVVPAIEWITDTETTLEWRVVTKVNAVTPWVISAPTSWDDSAVTETSATTYSLEEIFISSTAQWVNAQDPKTNEILNGAYFKYASVSQSQTGQPVVVINFDDKWKEIFCNLTEVIVGQQMAIFVGWEQVTAPVIREKICWWSAQIDGEFNMEWAKLLVDDLNEWALPAPLILAHEEKVSATLWEKALQGAMIAWWVWLLLVFVYMLITYGVRKWSVAIVTLLSFLIVLFAIVKLIGFALSLSGIAAILLSIGMWVDANVLIYERVEEEQAAGKSILQSVIDWYERSWSAIRDWNITTWMIALLLFFIGTNVFKWFGTMMIVNILLTLFILVPMTKYLLMLFLWASNK